MATLKDIYDRRTLALEGACRQLRSILAGVVAAIDDKTLVRAEVHSVRFKGLSSIDMPASIGAGDILLAGLYALARGEARAISKVRRDARREWREIDQIARREMLANLPSTIDELIEQLESSSSDADIEGWADALEATHACTICGTRIVDPCAFAEVALRHYDAADEDGELQNRIETAIRRSSTETGGWGDGSLCAYHNEQASKDD